MFRTLARGVLLVGVGGALALGLGVGCSGAGSEGCPASDCSPELMPDEFCRSNMLGSCEEESTTIDDGATVCVFSRFHARTNCDADYDIQPGVAECLGSACVLKNERCPANSLGFCRDGDAFRCQGDRVVVPALDCARFAGASCFSVTRPDYSSDGVCALEPFPCEFEPTTSEPDDAYGCEGNTAVHCHLGYPLERTECPFECRVDDGVSYCVDR